jgi:hypothetical protein
MRGYSSSLKELFHSELWHNFTNIFPQINCLLPWALTQTPLNHVSRFRHLIQSPFKNDSSSKPFMAQKQHGKFSPASFWMMGTGSSEQLGLPSLQLSVPQNHPQIFLVCRVFLGLLRFRKKRRLSLRNSTENIAELTEAVGTSAANGPRQLSDTVTVWSRVAEVNVFRFWTAFHVKDGARNLTSDIVPEL